MALKPGIRGWNPKPIKTLPGKDTKGKVKLNPEAFDALIDGQGVRVRVYRSATCPSLKSIDGGEHEIDCTLCHGEGFVDRYPLETWSYFQNQTLEKAAAAEGLIDGNTVGATFMQGVELQYFTLVELMDFTEAFFQVLKRQEGQLDVLRYPGVRINMCLDKSGREYHEGTDFQLDPNGNLRWCANKGPEAGMIYTINYETTVRYRAVNAIHANRFAQIQADGGTQLIKMNEQWRLSRSWQVVRKDSAGNVIAPNRIADVDED